MSNDKDKQYCVIDHANKQWDRKRGYPTGHALAKKPQSGGQSGLADQEDSESIHAPVQQR